MTTIDSSDLPKEIRKQTTNLKGGVRDLMDALELQRAAMNDLGSAIEQNDRTLIQVDNNTSISPAFQRAVITTRVADSFRNLEARDQHKETIIDTFGDFEVAVTKKKGRKVVSKYKTSDELIAERNSRLAIANKMFAANEITKEDFMGLVVSIRRCYKYAIEDQLAEELAEQENKNKKSKLRNFIENKVLAKIKSLFHIGKGKEKIVVDDIEFEENFIIEADARLALETTAKFLKEDNKNDAEVEECLADAKQMAIGKDREYDPELVKLIGEYDKKSDDGVKYTLNSTKVVTNNNGSKIIKPKTKNEINTEQMSFVTFLTNNYEHTAEGKMVGDESRIFLTFKDPKVQKAYKAMIKNYKANLENAKRCQSQDKELDTNTEKVLQDMAIEENL